MNNIETLVYGIVRKHPFIKRMVKTIYQGLFDLLPREKDFLLGDYDYVEGYFFGFHDQTIPKYWLIRCLLMEECQRKVSCCQ